LKKKTVLTVDDTPEKVNFDGFVKSTNHVILNEVPRFIGEESQPIIDEILPRLVGAASE